MASIEVVGLVLGSFPLLLSAIKNYDSGAERFKGLPKPSTGLNDEGSWMTWFLYLFFNDSLDVMVKVEQYVLGADDAQVIAFLNSYTSSFNMIGVAGAIIAQVAITAMSLTSLADSHWTAQAFFILSLVTGALAVFFSCAISPAFHGLHSAPDIKDFLTKPVDFKLRKNIYSRLHNLQEAMIKSRRTQDLAEPISELNQILLEEKWKSASCYSAIMLVTPMKLLNISLNAFLVGLGIYLGEVYTAQLIPQYRTGAIGLLIVFILASLVGIALFYIPERLKRIESRPTQHLANILRKFEKSASKSRQASHGSRTRPNAGAPFPRSIHFRSGTGVSYRVPEGTDNQSIELAEINSEDTPGPSSHPHVSAQSEAPYTSPPRQSASDHLRNNERPETDQIRLALAELIRSQEESVQASRRLLLAFEASAEA